MMANLDFDPTAIDPNAIDPITRMLTSQPVPRLAHGPVPGIQGVVTPGLWDRAGATFAQRFGTDQVTPPSNQLQLASETPTGDDILPGTTSRILDPNRSPIGVDAAVGRLGLAAPGRMDASFPDVALPTTKSSREAAGSDAAGTPLALMPKETAAVPPTATPTQAAEQNAPPHLFPAGAPTANQDNPANKDNFVERLVLGERLFPEGSMLDRLLTNIGNFRDANRSTLMALAGGLAGSQSIGQGLGRAFTAAGPAMQADIARGNQNMTVTALMNKGMDRTMAVAFASNPGAMTQILPYMAGVNNLEFK